MSKVVRQPPPPAKPVVDDDDAEEPKYKPIDLKMVRRLALWLKPYKRQYILGISAGSLVVLAQMTGPWFIQRLVDYTTSFVHGDLPAAITRAAAVRHSALLVLLWGAVTGVSLVLERARILI